MRKLIDKQRNGRVNDRVDNSNDRDEGQKNISYFKVQDNQVLPLKDQTFYSGGQSVVGSSWTPNGRGEYELNDNKLIKGQFNKEGFLQGDGEMVFYKEKKGDKKGGVQETGMFNMMMMMLFT
mmetsp:Transcript_27790/g.26607  ORF Transcript_27790/g.26607 Transcript_27790/m.26607 type:complete len:122 (+) Transcript_27790:257-622(+)